MHKRTITWSGLAQNLTYPQTFGCGGWYCTGVKDQGGRNILVLEKPLALWFYF